MKKIAIALILITALLVGCGKSTTKKDEFSYTINKVTVVPGEDFSKIKDSLGDPLDYIEAASCYFDGMDKQYSYDGFEIRTYPKDGVDYIQDLCIKSDAYETDKNIKVGSSLNDVTKAYGDDANVVGSMHKYSMGDNKFIYFFVLDDTVKYWGYIINVNN